MPDIKDTVGDGGKNLAADVALAQVMLRVIKDAKGVAFLKGNYDGAYGGVTKAAITAFQLEHKLAAAAKAPAPDPKAMAKVKPPPAPPDKLGLVAPKSATLNKLNALLPANYRDMRVIPGGKTVYLPDTKADANASAKIITGKADLEHNFRIKVVAAVQGMFQAHKIALSVTKSGWRRSFAEQAKLVKTNAGPGESNHNFGRAVDIGFQGLTWIEGDGRPVKDDYWLNTMYNTYDKKKNFKTPAFWNARDAIAKAKGIFPLSFERIHLQAWAHKPGLERRSLAKHLTQVGAMKWKDAAAPMYQCDLGSGGPAIYPVGSAKQIWAGNSPVTKNSLAAATNAKMQKALLGTPGGLKGFKPITAGQIKAVDLNAMRKSLKSDFELADKHWKKWAPVP